MTFEELPFVDLESGGNWLAALANARQRAPLQRSNEGAELLSYEMCELLLRDENWRPGGTRILDKHEQKGAVFERAKGLNLLSSEGADHRRARKAVQPWFNVRRAQDLKDVTRKAALDLMSAGTARGACEFLTEVGERLPARLFCWMVGARQDQSEEIKRLSLSIMKIFEGRPDEMPEIMAAFASLKGFIADLIEVKRKTPGDDLTSSLLQAVKDGLIEDGDVYSLTSEILIASSDNTAHMSSLMIWTLCQHPDQLARVRQDRRLIPTAVEECMRVSPRMRRHFFYNPEPCEFAGVSFPAFTSMIANYAAANRDPAVFTDPDRFDVGRKHPSPQLIFGVGRHHCLGASLVRMELQELLEVILDEWEDIRIEDRVQPVRYGTMGVNMPSLPLRITRACAAVH